MIKPYGLPIKSGFDVISQNDWLAIKNFIESKTWLFDEPAIDEDQGDPLLKENPGYGAFMLCFDFHLTPNGPRLIEINTNAGGLATVFHLESNVELRKKAEQKFVQALRNEYRLAGHQDELKNMAIVDDDITEQTIYLEMKYFATLLQNNGIFCALASPEELIYKDNLLLYKDSPINLIYNRLIDFRLTQLSHQIMREAVIKKQVILTPHPAIFSRVADKRNLIRLKSAIVPQTFLLKDKSMDEWIQTRKNWVFKPADGAGAKGVYRGDKISLNKLKDLPSETIVQEYAQPTINEDGSKSDLRVYTYGTEILGIIGRHFSGQVMEMRSDMAGFRAVLIN